MGEGRTVLPQMNWPSPRNTPCNNARSSTLSCVQIVAAQDGDKDGTITMEERVAGRAY